MRSAIDSTASRAKRRRLTFDLYEIGLLIVLLAAVSLAGQARHEPRGTTEVGWLRDTYGPARDSEHAEEWIVLDFFQGLRDGVFLDVGAAHYRTYSNTWRLERELGWSGIAVDAQESFGADYKRHRPRTRFHVFFVSDRSDERAKLFMNSNEWVASSSESFTARWGKAGTVTEVPTVTLDDLLARERVETLDFLTMDIELAEPKALAGFDLRKFRPRLVCVEAHPEVRQALLDYFTERDYVVVGKYLRVDAHNLYFMPRGTEIAPFPIAPVLHASSGE